MYSVWLVSKKRKIVSHACVSSNKEYLVDQPWVRFAVERQVGSVPVWWTRWGDVMGDGDGGEGRLMCDQKE